MAAREIRALSEEHELELAERWASSEPNPARRTSAPPLLTCSPTLPGSLSWGLAAECSCGQAQWHRRAPAASLHSHDMTHARSLARYARVECTTELVRATEVKAKEVVACGVWRWLRGKGRHYSTLAVLRSALLRM